MQFNITTVYPGTEMYEWAKRNKYLIAKDWSNYNVSDCVMELPTVSNDILKKYYKLAHKKFYLRPKVILRRLSRTHTITQLIQEVKGALIIINS